MAREKEGLFSFGALTTTPDRKMVSFSVLWLLHRVQKSEPNITWRKQACEHETCSGVIFWSQLLKSYPRIFNDGLRPGHTTLTQLPLKSVEIFPLMPAMWTRMPKKVERGKPNAAAVSQKGNSVFTHFSTLSDQGVVRKQSYRSKSLILKHWKNLWACSVLILS